MNYIPDSVFAICGSETNDCTVCKNNLYSNVVNGLVHDTQRGKVFCPFGMGNSMNQNIFTDQLSSDNTFMSNIPGWATSTWGHVPQMDPRPLAKIGLSWRTS